MNEFYWIQYDPNSYMITSITQDNKMDQDDWQLVAVSSADDQYFRNNYSRIKFDTINRGLIYPNDAVSNPQVVQSYSNDTVNSLRALYEQNSEAISNVSQRYFDSLASVASSASSYDQATSAKMSDLYGIAAINKGVNYLNGGQETGIINYIMYSLSFDFSHIYDALPTYDKPVELTVTVESPMWKYIEPQFATMNNVDVQEHNVSFYGANVAELRGVIGTMLSQHANTAWAVLHYGANITIPHAGLYFR